MATTMQRSNTLPAPGDPDSPVTSPSATTTSSAARGSPRPTGGYRENLTPGTGAVLRGRRSAPADVELALDAAHAAKDAWARRSPAERAAVLNAIADAMEANLEMLAVAES